jgi:chitin disaccharide deacetylase
MCYYFIVNADDFGMNSEVNKSIINSFNNGICSSTTLISNMSGFDESVSIIKDYSLNNRVGIHLNLTEGVPLTKGILKSPLFCDENGLFCFIKNSQRIFSLPSDLKSIVYNELSQQIDRCRENGIKITHADSHNHIHEEPGLFWLIMRLLKKKNIPYVRKLRNIGWHSSLSRRIYRKYINHSINICGMNGSDYFCGIDHFFDYSKDLPDGSIIEIMIHPGKLEKNQTIDIFDGKILDDYITKLSEIGKFISYGDIPHL